MIENSATATNAISRAGINDAPSRELRTGGAIAGFFFVGLLGWAAFTPLDAGAYAEGVVAVSGKRMMEEVATQLRDVQVRLDELQPKLVSIREQLGRSTVRALASGRVVGLKVFTIGDVVAAGETLMEVVPQDRALVIEGKVAPTDADDLTTGIEAQVRFTALQERNLPILKGLISKVSADTFEDPRTGGRHFRIEVRVPAAELAKLRQIRSDGGIRAGLPADVMIPLRKRSALSYLTEPLTQTLWLGGREN